MIAFLKGELRELEPTGDAIVLAGVVGYAVRTPYHPGRSKCSVGGEIELHVHTQVRQDSIELFGFLEKEERALFEALISVNGIGPKAALTVLSNVDGPRLVELILAEDADSLTKLPGIGKKTADRIVLELPAILRRRGLEAVSPRRPAGASSFDPAVFEDAKQALLGLGYKEPLAESLLRKVSESGLTSRDAVDWVREALKGARAC